MTQRHLFAVCGLILAAFVGVGIGTYAILFPAGAQVVATQSRAPTNCRTDAVVIPLSADMVRGTLELAVPVPDSDTYVTIVFPVIQPLCLPAADLERVAREVGWGDRAFDLVLIQDFAGTPVQYRRYGDYIDEHYEGVTRPFPTDMRIGAADYRIGQRGSLAVTWYRNPDQMFEAREARQSTSMPPPVTIPPGDGWSEDEDRPIDNTSPGGRTATFPLDNHQYEVALVEISGRDSANARMVGVATSSSIAEWCTRNPGGYPGGRTGCARTVLAEERGRRHQIRADCGRALLTWDDGSGTYRFVTGYAATWAGWIPVDIDQGEEPDFSRSGNQESRDEQFNVLCPSYAIRSHE